jgi:hypothetical protein
MTEAEEVDETKDTLHFRVSNSKHPLNAKVCLSFCFRAALLQPSQLPALLACLTHLSPLATFACIFRLMSAFMFRSVTF